MADVKLQFDIKSSSIHKRIDELSLLIKGGKNEMLRGTYIESELAIVYIQWLSPYFNLFAARIIKDYAAQEMRIEKARVEADNLNLRDRIEAMRKEMEENTKAMLNKMDNTVNTIVQSRDQVVAELKDVKNELTDSHVANIQLEKSVNDLSDRIEVIVDAVKADLSNKIVPPIENDTGDEMFVLFKKRDVDAVYPYYIICRKIDDAMAFIKKNRNIEEAKRIMTDIYSTTSPNSKNLLNHIRSDEYFRGSAIDKRRKDVVPRELPKITWHRNDFKIVEERITEAEFIENIKRLEAIRDDIIDETVKDN